MKGIAILAPDDKSFEQAQEILSVGNYPVTKCKLIETARAAEEARTAAAEGAEIIIARGHQAYHIKRQTKVLVVEIQLTAQELGLLVMEAKGLVDKERPRIGLFGWGDMLSDTSYFNDLYQVDLRRYTLCNEEDRVRGVLAIERERLDVVIGGQGMLRAAQDYGIPGVYLVGTGESMRIALDAAESTLRVIEKQQYNEKQLAYVMDVMNQGVIKLDRDGSISFVNATMEKIIGISRQKCIGQRYSKYLKGLDEDRIVEVCNGRGEGFSFFYKHQGEELYFVADPITTASGNDGAVLMCNRASAQHMDEQSRVIMREGKRVYRTFDDINKDMKELQQIAEKAKLFAKSASPILIEGGTGTEMELICEGIHSYSDRKSGPFLTINITGMDNEQQREALFGVHTSNENVMGAIEKANYGTLVIGSIDKLTVQNQYKLAMYIRNKIIPDAQSGVGVVNTRIITYTTKSLAQLRTQYVFRDDLYFLLKSLKLRIPRLRERNADVSCLLDEHTRYYMKLYERYHVLTAGARRVLLEYPWDGNSIQIQSFCERMILTANKRNITEEYVRNLLEELYAVDSTEGDGNVLKRVDVTEQHEDKADPMKRLIDQTLRKYNGNRTLTAKELGISTTTLWRKMKNYGLE